MIFFDDLSLCTIAPVRVVDVVVGGVKQNAVSRTRPLKPGADFVRSVPTTRTITIQFALLRMEPSEREGYLSAVRAWAHPGTPGRLVVPSRPDEYITAVCTGLPDVSTRQWWEDKLKLTFTAYEPFFCGLSEHHADAGTTAHIKGDAPPKAWLTKTVQAGAQTITASDGTNTLAISGTLDAGAVVVDLTTETVLHSTMGNIDRLLTFTSRFPQVHAGANTITGMDLHFIERWY